ncbi:hypothetical protein LCGC14_2050820 [marine sediment metagenome]|uniref:Uncharacterized protein n=1 Tax=marine sediment metagenome TaxID=412755 RepID=A0A0F9H2K3_9ZZZZ
MPRDKNRGDRRMMMSEKLQEMSDELLRDPSVNPINRAGRNITGGLLAVAAAIRNHTEQVAKKGN